MKEKTVTYRVIRTLLILFMLSFLSCEKQDCKICENSQGDTMEVCTDGGEVTAYFMGYYNCY